MHIINITVILHVIRGGGGVTAIGGCTAKTGVLNLTPVGVVRGPHQSSVKINTQWCILILFGIMFNPLWCYVQTLGCKLRVSRPRNFMNKVQRACIMFVKETKPFMIIIGRTHV